MMSVERFGADVMRARRVLLVLYCAVLGLSWSAWPRLSAAQEQADDPAVTATARVLAVDGVKLAQSDHCADAIDKLEQAEKLHHAPIVLTRLGECYIKLGRLLAGVESLRAVLREPLPPNPSEALSQAYADARSLLDATKPKLATLTVRVDGVADTAQLTLSIDGKNLPSALLGAAQPSDPGEHQIQVAAPGFVTASRRVSLAPGEVQTVFLTPVAAAHGGDEARTPESSEVPAQRSTTIESEMPAQAAPAGAVSASHLPAYITWGASVAALGVGVAFGIMALNDKANLDQRCPNKACPADAQRLLDDSHMHATVSTVASAVGLAGAAVGGLLFWLESSSPERPATAQSGVRVSAAPSGVRLTF